KQLQPVQCRPVPSVLNPLRPAVAPTAALRRSMDGRCVDPSRRARSQCRFAIQLLIGGSVRAIELWAGDKAMASIPLIEEQVGEDFLVLNVEKVGLSDDQFFELCSDNRELCFELTAQKLIIMTLPGAKTMRRNTAL